MNAVVEMKSGALVAPDAGRMSVANVVQQAMVVQEVMKAVMKNGVHYGTIPGTDKPTLYKAGAEKLCLVFHVADEYRVEDLSTGPDAIRYRVTCVGKHQQTGIELGQGIGEAQTGEEKYRWRKAVCDEEFDETPTNLRRIKFGRGKGGSTYKIKQVRTEPADLANTVLKMAAKRAKMAMVLNVLAASDAFGQDLEDLDDTLREHLTESDDGAPQAAAAPAAPVTWPAPQFAAQLDRWTKAVLAGIKSIDDILALARSKGALTAEQEASIKAIPLPPAAASAQPAADLPWQDEPHGAAQ